jgi:hypothetical protein
MQNDDHEFHQECYIGCSQTRTKYVEKMVYVTDAGTAVMIIEEIKRYYKDGLFDTFGRFDGDRFILMMDHLIKKYTHEIK